MYISNDSCTSTTKRRHDLESADVECITLELHSDPKHILFFTYRPPDQSPTMFFDCMRNLLATAEKVAAILTLLGDMNAKHPSWQTSGPHNMAGEKLFNLLLDFGMTQCVEDPTRFSPDGDSHSVIDVYATNHPDLVTAINVSDPNQLFYLRVSDPISDHCMVTTHLREPCTQRKHKRNESSSSDGSFPSKIVPDFRNVDWHGLRALQGTDNVNCAVAVWESLFVEILQRHIPNRYIRHRPKNKVWMTSKLHRLSKQNFDSSKKLEQVDHLKIGPHTVNTEIFALPSFVQRNQLNNLHRKHEEIASATDGSPRWWTLAKQLAKISTPHLAIPDLRADEDVTTTDFEKATLLAKYFASQCTSTAPPEHLKGAPFPLPEKQPIFDFLPIPELTVLRTLQHLPISKAMAHLLITNRVLRECAPFICPSITHLFNLSIATGVFSDAWKRATVTPIFKNRGTAGDPSNYRPVSVNSGPSLPKARHKPERRGGGKTGMIDVNGKNNKVEQKNNKKIKTMGDVTLKGYDMTNTVTKGTGVRVHKQ